MTLVLLLLQNRNKIEREGEREYRIVIDFLNSLQFRDKLIRATYCESPLKVRALDHDPPQGQSPWALTLTEFPVFSYGFSSFLG